VRSLLAYHRKFSQALLRGRIDVNVEVFVVRLAVRAWLALSWMLMFSAHLTS
jgi:hypothetical protein